MKSPHKADLIAALTDLQLAEARFGAAREHLGATSSMMDLTRDQREEVIRAIACLTIAGDRARALLATGDANTYSSLDDGDNVARREAALNEARRQDDQHAEWLRRFQREKAERAALQGGARA